MSRDERWPAPDPNDARQMAQLQFHPRATRIYEDFFGGFFWLDEWTEADIHSEMLEILTGAVSHRSALIRGEPSENEDAWLYMKKYCPHWPGFHPERSSPALCAELDAAEKAFLDSEAESGS